MAFSLASPLAKFLNGLEILLSKAQVSPTLPFLSSLDLSKSCLMGCVVSSFTDPSWDPTLPLCRADVSFVFLKTFDRAGVGLLVTMLLAFDSSVRQLY